MALTKVSTDGVKDDAITSGKIPAQAIGTSEIADNTITQNDLANNSVGASQLQTGGVGTANIADEAVTLAKLEHGTSSNDGKFLRANNGADPTFETVTGTTINNNSNNRLITGSNTSNTLEGEANLTYNGQLLQATNSHINISSGYSYQWGDSHERIEQSDGKIEFFTNNGEQMTLSGGNLGIGTSSPASLLNVNTPASGSTTAIEISRTTHGTVGKFINSTGALEIQSNKQLILSSDPNQGMTAAGSMIQFLIDGSEKARMSSSGGISFNGDTAAANHLDDYEEGTFTPVLKGVNGGGTLTGSTGAGSGGNYTKIGNRVTFSFYFANPTGSNPSGYLYFEMPFTAASGNSYNGEGGAVTYTRNINPGSNRMFAVNAIANTNRLYITNVSVGGQGETYYQDISNDGTLTSMIFKASVSFIAA